MKDIKNLLKRKYSTPIKIIGTKKQVKEFKKNIEEFAPIAEMILLNGYNL